MIQLSPGLVVAIRCIWGEHWGIVSFESDRWTLISSRGLRNGVTEEPLEEVINGVKWRILDFASPLPAYIVIERARSMIGSRYDLWKWNCEDFVYWALGFPPRSPQRDAFAALVGVISLALMFRAAAKRS